MPELPLHLTFRDLLTADVHARTNRHSDSPESSRCLSRVGAIAARPEMDRAAAGHRPRAAGDDLGLSRDRAGLSRRDRGRRRDVARGNEHRHVRCHFGPHARRCGARAHSSDACRDTRRSPDSRPSQSFLRSTNHSRRDTGRPHTRAARAVPTWKRTSPRDSQRPFAVAARTPARGRGAPSAH